MRPDRRPTRAVSIHLLHTYIAAYPEEPLGPYLLGRYLADLDPSEAIGLLLKACPLPPPTLSSTTRRNVLGLSSLEIGQPLKDPAFIRTCRETVVLSALKTDAIELALRYQKVVVDDTNNQAASKRAVDLLQRIIWTKEHRARTRGPGQHHSP